MKEVYFDNNATTQIAPEVAEAIQPFLTTEYGNPSSMHNIGGRIKKHIDKAREQVAALINADPDEILFTSCGTESNNTALRGTLLAQPGKRHILTSKVEHPAVLEVATYLGTRGARVTQLFVDSDGLLNLDDVREAITDETAIVSVMWANNETGVIFPIQEIAEICAEKGVVFHTDAVQAVGKIPIDVKKTPVNMLSLSGHKLHTPKGIGALYIRKKTPLKPFMLGGHQERGRRAGTENVPFIVGLGVAADEAAKYMDDENTRVRALRDKLENALMKTCPDARRNGHKELRLPNTSNISFEFIEGEAILLLMDAEGIAASSGSACTSGSLEPSHVIRALGVPFTAVHGSTRFSLSRYNTEDEVDYVIEKVPPIVEKLRKMSPFVGGDVY
jgi:cysteine desulfurase